MSQIKYALLWNILITHHSLRKCHLIKIGIRYLKAISWSQHILRIQGLYLEWTLLVPKTKYYAKIRSYKHQRAMSSNSISYVGWMGHCFFCLFFKDFNYLCHLRVENWWETLTYFCFCFFLTKFHHVNCSGIFSQQHLTLTVMKTPSLEDGTRPGVGVTNKIRC